MTRKTPIDGERKNLVRPRDDFPQLLRKEEDAEAIALAKASLVRLLPQLRASDAYLLNDKQRTRLRRALSGTDKPLTLARPSWWRKVFPWRFMISRLDSKGVDIGGSGKTEKGSRLFRLN
jgi:hypothetical protein